ncbi:MAG: histidine kinase [Candidatus Peregrinibacteria bacterium Gr01-1014_25]|nr:MAG: histidine kinase [Candidatus Peregrinibacteria bacterium Gr01-1014_25]
MTWLGGGLILLAIGITASVSWVLYEHTVNLLTDNLRQRLLSIAITQAANIDYQDMEALQEESDWKKPAWARVVTKLKRAKDENPNIVFMYIFRKTKNDPTLMEFVADAESINPYANTDDDITNDIDANSDGKIEPEGPDQLQWPGQPYPEPPEEAFEAYKGPLTNRELYEDSYGQVLTGYAPIRDINGKIVAIIGTDIKVNDFLVVTRQTLFPFLAFIFLLIGILLILACALIKIWNNRVELVEDLDRQKDELLGIVTHQLATPVSSLKWYCEMLLDGDMGELNKEQKENLVTAQGVVHKMNDLVSMILDVSRVQLGRMQVNRDALNVQEVIGETVDVMRPKAAEQKVDFRVSLPKSFPPARLDKRLVQMTMDNLLSNAIKYTPTGGHVDFTVTIRDGVMHYVVRDTGCGIPKAEQERAFDKLFRASNVRNQVKGNGFGLYVAKGAVEALGGSIRFESDTGKGTTFYVSLPLTEEAIPKQTSRRRWLPLWNLRKKA